MPGKKDIVQSFISAVTLLATSPAIIQERVLQAYLFHLMDIDLEDIPEDCRTSFKTTADKLDSILQGEVPNFETKRLEEHMNERDAVFIAQEIVYMTEMIWADSLRGSP
jgi:hypothetical protein